jgi:hypothetical protein
MITITRASGHPVVNGIFCRPASSWNTAYLVDEPLDRTERILHAAVFAVRQVAAYPARERATAAGRTVIRDIFLKIDVKKFISWYEGGNRYSGATPRCAALLRDLDDAAVLVGECSGCRPVVRFIKPSYPHTGSFHHVKNSQQAAGDLAARVLHGRLGSKLRLRRLFEIDTVADVMM